jgi:hypothetical protein
VSELDLDALRQALTPDPASNAPAYVWLHRTACDMILAALERAEEVADQSCEFCDNAVDDLGEERDGGREPHAHWWKCGECSNRDAIETSTIIGHLSDLLDRALERIPELEQELGELGELHDQQADDMDVLLKRAKRAEAELTQAADEIGHLREALNDEMYAHEATRQRAERVEAALVEHGCKESGNSREWCWDQPTDGWPREEWCWVCRALAPQEEPS